MSATFDSTLPTPKDSIRFALGDTDVAASNAMLQDETIESLLTQFGYTEALAQCADALVSEYAQMPSEFSDDVMRYKWTERISAWKRIADNARAGNIVAPGATASQTSSARVAVGQIVNPIATAFRSD